MTILGVADELIQISAWYYLECILGQPVDLDRQ